MVSTRSKAKHNKTVQRNGKPSHEDRKKQTSAHLRKKSQEREKQKQQEVSEREMLQGDPRPPPQLPPMDFSGRLNRSRSKKFASTTATEDDDKAGTPANKDGADDDSVASTNENSTAKAAPPANKDDDDDDATVVSTNEKSTAKAAPPANKDDDDAKSVFSDAPDSSPTNEKPVTATTPPSPTSGPPTTGDGTKPNDVEATGSIVGEEKPLPTVNSAPSESKKLQPRLSPTDPSHEESDDHDHAKEQAASSVVGNSDGNQPPARAASSEQGNVEQGAATVEQATPSKPREDQPPASGEGSSEASIKTSETETEEESWTNKQAHSMRATLGLDVHAELGNALGSRSNLFSATLAAAAVADSSEWGDNKEYVLGSSGMEEVPASEHEPYTMPENFQFGANPLHVIVTFSCIAPTIQYSKQYSIDPSEPLKGAMDDFNAHASVDDGHEFEFFHMDLKLLPDETLNERLILNGSTIYARTPDTDAHELFEDQDQDGPAFDDGLSELMKNFHRINREKGIKDMEQEVKQEVKVEGNPGSDVPAEQAKEPDSDKVYVYVNWKKQRFPISFNSKKSYKMGKLFKVFQRKATGAEGQDFIFTHENGNILEEDDVIGISTVLSPGDQIFAEVVDDTDDKDDDYEADDCTLEEEDDFEASKSKVLTDEEASESYSEDEEEEEDEEEDDEEDDEAEDIDGSSCLININYYRKIPGKKGKQASEIDQYKFKLRRRTPFSELYSAFKNRCTDSKRSYNLLYEGLKVQPTDTLEKLGLRMYDQVNLDAYEFSKVAGKRRAGLPPVTIRQQMDANARDKLDAIASPMELNMSMTLPFTRSDKFEPDPEHPTAREQEEKRWPWLINGLFSFTEQKPNDNGQQSSGGSLAKPQMHVWVGSDAAKDHFHEFFGDNDKYELHVHTSWESYCSVFKTHKSGPTARKAKRKRPPAAASSNKMQRGVL